MALCDPLILEVNSNMFRLHKCDLLSNPLYKQHQIPKNKCFSSRLHLPLCYAPTTSERATILMPNKVSLILRDFMVLINKHDKFEFMTCDFIPLYAWHHKAAIKACMAKPAISCSLSNTIPYVHTISIYTKRRTTKLIRKQRLFSNKILKGQLVHRNALRYDVPDISRARHFEGT